MEIRPNEFGLNALVGNISNVWPVKNEEKRKIVKKRVFFFSICGTSPESFIYT